MGLFDKITKPFKEAVNNVSKAGGNITKQIKRDFDNSNAKLKKDFTKFGDDVKKQATKAGDVIKKEAIKAGDEIKKEAIKTGDVIKKEAIKAGDVIKTTVQDENFQRSVANIGFTAAEILAPEFAPELLAGQMAVNAAIEAAHTKDIPYNAILSAGTAAATGQFSDSARGTSNLSMGERLGQLKQTAITEGTKQAEAVKEKITDRLTQEGTAKYNEITQKITDRLGFDPTKIESTEDALQELKKQVDKNKRLQDIIDKMNKAKNLENLTKMGKDELKKRSTRLIDDVVDKVNEKKTKAISKVAKKMNEKKSQIKKTIKKNKNIKKLQNVGCKMANIVDQVKKEKQKNNRKRFRYSSAIQN